MVSWPTIKGGHSQTNTHRSLKQVKHGSRIDGRRMTGDANCKRKLAEWAAYLVSGKSETVS